MALNSKKCIVMSSNVFNECAVLKNSANVIKIIKSAALKAAVNNNHIIVTFMLINNHINIHSPFQGYA